MRVHKRSYSPTVEDVRQHNIKKQRLLEDFDALNLDTRYTKHYETVQPVSFKDREFIPDIDEFLLLNQEDRDVLEGSKHIEWDAAELEKVVIPEQVIRVNALTESNKASLQRVLGDKARFLTDEEILLEYELMEHWSLVKYVQPQELVYRHWERWWLNVYKLGEFVKLMDTETDMDMDMDMEMDTETEDYMDIDL